jgi:hypothetical protein
MRLGIMCRRRILHFNEENHHGKGSRFHGQGRFGPQEGQKGQQASQQAPQQAPQQVNMATSMPNPQAEAPGPDAGASGPQQANPLQTILGRLAIVSRQLGAQNTVIQPEMQQAAQAFIAALQKSSQAAPGPAQSPAAPPQQ